VKFFKTAFYFEWLRYGFTVSPAKTQQKEIWVWRVSRTAGQQVSKSANLQLAELRAARMASLAAMSFALLPSIYEYAPMEGYILQTPAVGLTAFGSESERNRCLFSRLDL